MNRVEPRPLRSSCALRFRSAAPQRRRPRPRPRAAADPPPHTRRGRRCGAGGAGGGGVLAPPGARALHGARGLGATHRTASSTGGARPAPLRGLGQLSLGVAPRRAACWPCSCSLLSRSAPGCSAVIARAPAAPRPTGGSSERATWSRAVDVPSRLSQRRRAGLTAARRRRTSGPAASVSTLSTSRESRALRVGALCIGLWIGQSAH